jgi:hypothetical protein
VKTPDKFRFSLQWGAETVEQIQAGDFLESLGNRKSEFVVMAVAAYLSVHPEAYSPGQKPKIIVRPSYTRDQVEAMVRAIIEEKLAGVPPMARQSGNPGGEEAAAKSDVEAMLKNLDLF